MLDYKIQQYNKEIKRLDRALRKFERLDNKDSSVFLKSLRRADLEIIWILLSGLLFIRCEATSLKKR